MLIYINYQIYDSTFPEILFSSKCSCKIVLLKLSIQYAHTHEIKFYLKVAKGVENTTYK